MPRLVEHRDCNPACRACHYKDHDYPTQLEKKRTWASKNLARWSSVLAAIAPAPEKERLGYRAKTWMRACARSDGEATTLSFGMFRAVQFNGAWEQEFVSWDRCPIHLDAIRATTKNIREILSRHAPEFASQSLFGVWIGSPHLVLVAKTPPSSALLSIDWSRVLVSPISHAWFHQTSQVGRKIFGRGPITQLFGPSVEGRHPIRAFRQVAQTLLQNARQNAVEFLLHDRPTLVVDLYCGTGDLSLLLPGDTAWLGIEISKEAVDYARALRDPSVQDAYIGTVEQRLADPRVLAKIIGRIALYLNPPRSGLTEDARKKVIELLKEHLPSRVVYLSCSASSLARDLTHFEPLGYRVVRLQPYDFFPQTEHFETLALLERTS